MAHSPTSHRHCHVWELGCDICHLEGRSLDKKRVKNPNRRMGEPTKKKSYKQSNWIWTEQKAVRLLLWTQSRCFSLLAAGSCSHNCMALNPVSHFVVRSLFSSPVHIENSPQQAVGHNNNNKINKKCKQAFSASRFEDWFDFFKQLQMQNLQMFTEALLWKQSSFKGLIDTWLQKQRTSLASNDRKR